MKSIVKSSKAIRKALKMRKNQLKLSQIDICKEAEVRGIKIAPPTLSKYFSDSEDNNLSEESILYLCDRFMIPVELMVGIPSVGFDLIMPDYNEDVALKEVRKKYPVKYAKRKETQS